MEPAIHVSMRAFGYLVICSVLTTIGFMASSGSLEARTIKTPLCVSFSELTGMTRDVGAKLVNAKNLSATEKKIVGRVDRSQDDAKNWYDAVRVSKQSVLLAIEF